MRDRLVEVVLSENDLLTRYSSHQLDLDALVCEKFITELASLEVTQHHHFHQLV